MAELLTGTRSGNFPRLENDASNTRQVPATADNMTFAAQAIGELTDKINELIAEIAALTTELTALTARVEALESP